MQTLFLILTLKFHAWLEVHVRDKLIREVVNILLFLLIKDAHGLKIKEGNMTLGLLISHLTAFLCGIKKYFYCSKIFTPSPPPTQSFTPLCTSMF